MPMPMLWNPWSVKNVGSGRSPESAWQLLQRALPMKRFQPRRAGSLIAPVSPAMKESNGEPNETWVRSQLASELLRA